MSTTYQECQALAAEICRQPGGYQVRTSAADPFISVKGGRMKGWVKFTPEEACERFGLPYPEPAEEAA